MEDVRPQGEECRYAEHHAPFIFNCLEKLRVKLPAKEFVYKHGFTTPAEIPKEIGLYMFYAEFDGYDRYPVYIGKTEQGFRTRFDRHARDGVIWRFNTGQFPTFPKKDPQLRAILLTFPIGFAMKLAESMFLGPFDFALNKMENDFVRLEIKSTFKYDPVFSYDTYFSKYLDAVKDQTEKLVKALT